MAVSPAHIAVGHFYVRFTELREVIGVARSGDVTFLSRPKANRGGVSVTLDTRPSAPFIGWGLKELRARPHLPSVY